jgi:mono/diheme cytochrome c family protein
VGAHNTTRARAIWSALSDKWEFADMEAISKMRAATALGIAVGLTLALSRPLLAQNLQGNAESGRLYAINWCIECHSVEPETEGTGTFAPDFTAIAKRRTTTFASLHTFLRSNHTLMPDFKFKLSEAADIVTYIMSLKRR